MHVHVRARVPLIPHSTNIKCSYPSLHALGLDKPLLGPILRHVCLQYLYSHEAAMGFESTSATALSFNSNVQIFHTVSRLAFGTFSLISGTLAFQP